MCAFGVVVLLIITVVVVSGFALIGFLATHSIRKEAVNPDIKIFSKRNQK